MEKLAS